MADIERTVRNLTVQLEGSTTDRRLTATIKFSVRVGPGPTGLDNYTIILPRLIDRRVEALLRNLKQIIANEDDQIRDLFVEKDVLIDLQQV